MTDARGKILVVRGGAIGDFVLTLPVLAALRQQFAACQLEVLGYPHIVGLALAGGLADRVQSIEARALAGFFARRGALDQDLADYFSEFSLIVSFLYDPDGVFRENLARCSPAQFIQGPHRPDEAGDRHATETLLESLEQLDIFSADAVPRLRIPAAAGSEGRRERTVAGESEPRRLAFHPGSGSERKNWPETRWVELLQALAQSTNLHFLAVGGEAEGDRLQRLARCLPAPRFRLARSLPLTELARQLQGCAAFIGHDSGITHLAAALGLPGLVLWGDTNEAVWRPNSPCMTVLRVHGGLARLDVATVLGRLNDLLAGAKQP